MPTLPEPRFSPEDTRSAHVIAYLAFTLWGVCLGTILGLLLGHHLWST